MECVICLETDTNNFKLLICNHSFHTICLDIWLINHDTCPLCRTLVKYIDATIDKRKYKISIEPHFIKFVSESHTSILKLVNIKSIDYIPKKNKIVIHKKEKYDYDLIKINIISKKSKMLLDLFALYTQRLAN
jgi:hypothetical protein